MYECSQCSVSGKIVGGEQRCCFCFCDHKIWQQNQAVLIEHSPSYAWYCYSVTVLYWAMKLCCMLLHFSGVRNCGITAWTPVYSRCCSWRPSSNPQWCSLTWRLAQFETEIDLCSPWQNRNPKKVAGEDNLQRETANIRYGLWILTRLNSLKVLIHSVLYDEPM